jgi:hypothetical protein
MFELEVSEATYRLAKNVLAVMKEVIHIEEAS